MSDPENNLPPVQPPSAGFLMQLFVVPMAIVVVIVMVCLMFNWLAHMGTSPQDLVDDLNKLNAGSWQKALTVANLLTDPRNAELRQDPALAKQLAKLLNDELQAANMEPERIELRVYLCLALGVFQVDEGMEELILAARLQRQPEEIEVQLTALEALARRADTTEEKRLVLQNRKDLLDALTEVDSRFSSQPDQALVDASLRERATFVYGVLGGDVAQERLVGLLADAQPTVRYNAAAGLARYGDTRAIPQLLEMLTLASRSNAGEAQFDQMTRDVVIRNALRAAVQFAEAKPDEDLTELRGAIDVLAENADRRVSNRLAMDAKMTAVKIQETVTPSVTGS